MSATSNEPLSCDFAPALSFEITRLGGLETLYNREAWYKTFLVALKRLKEEGIEEFEELLCKQT